MKSRAGRKQNSPQDPCRQAARHFQGGIDAWREIMILPQMNMSPCPNRSSSLTEFLKNAKQHVKCFLMVINSFTYPIIILVVTIIISIL